MTMRFLVIGAGSIGGYFGGRLMQAGQDVTFLVRPRRATALVATGLSIQSPHGDFHHPAPKLVQAGEIDAPFDVILLSCKAYDLDSAMDALAPAVGPDTVILPLLNGIRHLDRLETRFGAAHVLGGECVISSTLDADGRVLHLNQFHLLVFGERAGGSSPRTEAIAAIFADAGFDATRSDAILQDMWEKFVFIATAAGITCLMRASIGDIVAAGAAAQAAALLDECTAIATSQGFAPRPDFMDRSRGTVTAAGSPLTASVLRDIETGGRTEADQILGDLLRRVAPDQPAPVLALAYAHLQAYEARRSRESKAGD